MHRNIFRKISDIVRLHVGSLVIGWIGSAQAQGQGSYGGIAHGFFSLALVVVLIGATLILLVIRSIFGNKTALSLLLALAVGLGYLFIHANLSEAKRLRTYKKIEYAFAEGCASTSRAIERTAKGDERIFVRLHGADMVPEHQRSVLLPSQNGIAEGVEVVSDLPKDAKRAIVIDIQYSRDLIPGSYSGYEWYRTRYDLTARTVPGDEIVARTIDMEARNGFCLGDLEAFLTRALNRSGVLFKNGASRTLLTGAVLPDSYVRGEYSANISGVYLKSARGHNAFVDIKELLTKKGCRIKESTISPPLALCGSPPRVPVEIPLYGVIGLHPLPDSWLLTYRGDRGLTALTNLRVEQRLADWQLVRVWNANLVPPPGDTGGGWHLAEFAMDGDVMTAAAYWGEKWGYDRSQNSNWYTGRSALRVPLPGVKQ